MKIAPEFPVIGPFFHRRLVGTLAGAAKIGNLQAVRELSAIARSCSDPPARQITYDALGSLSSQQAIDVFCSGILDVEDPTLEKIAAERGYVPSEPGFAALFLLITGQEEALCRFDPDALHPILTRGYAGAPDRIKNRVLRSVLDSRMGHILAHALIGTDPVCAAGTWSYDEWEVIIASLTEEKSWELLWPLVVFAPPALAVIALNKMKVAGWRPGGDGEQVFCELVRELPEVWACPVPEKPILSMGNQDSPCMKQAFSSDSTLLATGNCDGRITIWQVKSARLITTITTDIGSINFLAFAPDNTYLISGGNNGILTCTGIPSGTTVWSYADKGHPVSYVALSVNGEEIVVGDDRGRMIRIGCRTGKILLTLPGHPSRVTTISPAPGGTSFVFGHADGTHICRNNVTGAEIWTVPGTGDPVRALAYTEQAEKLFVIYDRSLPVLRDACTGLAVRTYARFSGHFICAAISTENLMAAIGSDDNVLRLWDLHEKNPTAEVPLYNRRPACCALTPDGTLATVGCNDGTVYYYQVPDGKRVKELRAYKGAVTACDISPDGRILALSGSDGTVTLRDISSGELLRTLITPSGAVTALALTTGTGGAVIIAGTSDSRVHIFSRKNGTCVRSIDVYTPSVRALAVSPDGTYLACAGKETSLRIWDLAKGSLVATCETLKTTVRCLAFLPDKSALISGGWDGVVRYWDIPSGKLSGTLVGHSSIITCCCVDPEGRFVVTGSNDSTVRIWQRTGEKKSIIIRDAKQEVSTCAISPDGNLIAAAGTDPMIRLYHLPTGIAAGAIPQIPGKPTALVFTGDGLAIAAGYDHGTLAFYDIHGHSLIRTLSAHTGAVTGIVAIKGEDCIVTSGSDGMIHIFRVPFMRQLSRTTLSDLALVREQDETAGTDAMAQQWRFLCQLLFVRFQNEIEICPTYRDAGMYDIQIVG